MGCSQLLKSGAHTCNEGIGDVAMDKHSGGCGAHLGAIEGKCLRAVRNGALQVGVIEDDCGRLTSQLKCNGLQVALCSCKLYSTTTANRARIGDLGDTHVRSQESACRWPARDHVHYPWRKASLAKELSQVQRAQW